MIILLSLVWGICPVHATFVVHTIVTLGIWNAADRFLTLLGITIPTPYGLIPTVGVTEALHHVVSLDDLVSEGVKIIQNVVHQSNDKASHLRRFESSCPLRVSIIFFLKRRTINISRGLTFVNNFTLLSQLRISECDKCENRRERVNKFQYNIATCPAHLSYLNLSA